MLQHIRDVVGEWTVNAPARASVPIQPGDERMCPVCSGMGWYYVERRGAFMPELTRCTVCTSGKQSEFLRRMSRISPGSEMSTWRLDNFIKTNFNGEAMEWVRARLALPSGMAYLWGEHGVGKTRLLVTAVNEAISGGWTALFIALAELLDELRAAMLNDNAESSLLNRVLRARVLALDEADKFNATPWALTELSKIVNARYNDKRDAMTLIASNAEPDALPGYIESRLMDTGCAVFRLAGPDWRKLSGGLP